MVTLKTDDLSRLRKYDLFNITNISLLFLTLIIINFLLNYGHVLLLSAASQRIIYDLRVFIFSHLQALPFSFFDRNPVFSNVIITTIKDILLVAGIITIMFILNKTLAIVSISLFPILIILTIAFRLKAREIYRNVRTLLARINAYLAENISGMKTIQLFLREEENLERFKKINNLYFQSTMRNLKLNSVYRPAINTLSSFALALIVYYGGREFLKNRVEIGMLFLFFSYVQTLFRPIQDIAEKYDILQSAMASTERVVGLLNEPIPITNSSNPIRLDLAEGSIEFKNIWFSYTNDEWVLKNVSFKIHPGESVGFVGATGAGKTSIINLLCRFYEAQKGEILIDGINIKDLTSKDLRKNIAVIFQDVFLFATDIKENIRLNNRDISDEEVQAHLFIEE
ncbi:MAG: putative ABC transporter ATP-binding protein [candidate division WS2 bacterium]|nr:putative ABC transporter ATP-binding protein [Candidatus Lithacetigena glycinireducens]